MNDEILYAVEGGVGTIMLNRPQARNALTFAMYERIAEIYHDIDVRVRSSLMAALEALAPAPDRACERTLLAELIIALSMGLMTRRILSPDIEITAMSRLATALVDRELAALARAGA